MTHSDAGVDMTTILQPDELNYLINRERTNHTKTNKIYYSTEDYGQGLLNIEQKIRSERIRTELAKSTLWEESQLRARKCMLLHIDKIPRTHLM